MNVFYLVWNESGHNPTVKHATKVRAIKEASRLSRQHRSEKFHVLRSIGDCEISDVKWTEHVEDPEDDGIPF